MSKCIKTTKLTASLHLSECTDGFWLYDYTREMNVSMRAKTAQDALVEAIGYYQRRLTQVETQFKELNTKVEAFVNQVHKCPDEENW